MSRRVSGFSLMEIIVVLSIMVVMLVMAGSFFRPQNTDVLYGEICVNDFFGAVNSYTLAGITAKNLSSSTGVTINPDLYTINFDVTGQRVTLGYWQGAISGAYKILNLSGSQMRYCMTSEFRVMLSGQSSQVAISKGLQAAFGKSSFSISGVSNPFVHEMKVLVCNGKGGMCKDFFKIAVDTRIQQIRLLGCARRLSAGVCSEWRK